MEGPLDPTWGAAEQDGDGARRSPGTGAQWMPSQADGAEVTQSDSEEDSGEAVDAAWALWWG